MGPIRVRKEAFQSLNLRQIVDGDVGVSGISREEILMIGLGRVKSPIKLDLGDDRDTEDVSLIELGDIGFRGSHT